LKVPPSLSGPLLDFACQSYFVKPKEVIDYESLLQKSFFALLF
jgi:hypothetical protein